MSTQRQEVVPANSSFTPVPRGLLQRKCACDLHSPTGGACEECKKKQTLQRAAVSPRRGIGHSIPPRLFAGERTESEGDVPPIVHEVLRSPGEPLDLAARAFMEPRFGHDFSQMRVHSDAEAAESARAVNALAYTVGQDVVFGAGRYEPGSQQGRQLLAHELTHVVQQKATPGGLSKLIVEAPKGPEEAEADQAAEAVAGGVMALPLMNDRLVLRRQGGGAPAAPAVNAWAGCAAGNVGSLNRELAEATRWVQDAITDLQSSGWPHRTTNALFRYLSVDPPHVQNTIVPNLQLILADLQLGPSNFRCQTQAQCLAAFPGGADAYSGNPITLCPGYFDKDFLDRVTTLVHEAGHNAGLAGNVVEWEWPFAGLATATRLGNTESYAAFVRSNAHPALAPLQPTIGVSVGIGGLAPSSGGWPRFLVSAETDVILAQRVLRFFDLRLGLRVDVDSSGSVIGSESVGARLFSPTYLTAVPAFIDLRGGFAIGRLADFPPSRESTPLNVAGPTGEVRVGILPANWGASVGYRQIWNLLRDHPDIRELTIAGEIRF